MNRIVSVLLVNLVLKNNLLYAMCDWGLLTGQRVKGSDDSVVTWVTVSSKPSTAKLPRTLTVTVSRSCNLIYLSCHY